MAKGIIENELLIVDVFCDTIDLVLSFVTDDLRIGAGNYINFSLGQLLLKDGPLFDAYVQFEMISSLVLNHERNVLLLSLYELLEINIDLPSLGFIFFFSLLSVLLDIFHSTSSLFAIEFNLLDLVGAR